MRPSKEKIRAKVEELLKLIQLKNLAGRYPSQLSGGQRQRVALARALAVEPSVLLLDEPFGSLDAKVRLELRRWLRQLHDEVHITSVFVTHDQDEALEVSDRIAVMNEGRIEQVGSPDEVYHHPITPFVYNFLGNVNLFHGRIDEETPADSRCGDGRPGLRASAPAGDSSPAQRRTATFAPPSSTSTRPAHWSKIEALTEWGAPVHVELSQEKFRELQLAKDRSVFIIPKELKVFHKKVV